MDRLQAHLREMIKFVAGNLEASGTPTVEVLTSIVTGISDAIGRDASSLPPRVKQICANGFSENLGWDVRRKIVSRQVLFTAANLLAALQHVLDGVSNWSPPVTPSAEELADLSLACSKLWELDVNRLVPDHDYALNLQAAKGFFDQGDVARDPLFTFVDESVFQRPTYKAFTKLLNNYEVMTGVNESVSEEERMENVAFLNLIMDTACMQYVHQYLVAKGKTRAVEREAFIQELERAWFSLYSRNRANDSSGFEHVFLGEMKDDGEVVGLHNWIQMFQEERNGRFDYKGLIKPKGKPKSGGFRLPTSQQQLISLQFSWRGGEKPVSSSFIGTSPEFEMALFTLCYFDGEEQNVVKVGPYRVLVTCYKWLNKRDGSSFIASSFPGEAPPDVNEAASTIQAQFRGKQCRQMGAVEYSSRRAR